MEKRVVVFLILSLAIIIGYDYILKQTGLMPTPSDSDRPGVSDSSTPTNHDPGPSVVSKEPAPEFSQPSTPGTSSTSASMPPQVASDEQIQEVVTDLFRAVFTNHGAVITSWELKRYSIVNKESAQPVQMVYHGGKFKKPLAFQTMDDASTALLNDGLYHVQRDFSTLDAAHPTGHFTFSYAEPQTGVRAVKELDLPSRHLRCSYWRKDGRSERSRRCSVRHQLWHHRMGRRFYRPDRSRDKSQRPDRKGCARFGMSSERAPSNGWRCRTSTSFSVLIPLTRRRPSSKGGR